MHQIDNEVSRTVNVGKTVFKIKNKTVPKVIVLLGLPAAFFYLFVFPALVANHSLPPSRIGVAFAAFLYVQLWMLTAEYAYRSAASLYRFRRKHLWPFVRLGSSGTRGFASDSEALPRRLERLSGFATAFLCAVSYFTSIYGFALAYTFVSRADPRAFTAGELSVFSATYFSLTTAATVGYGDIAPISVASRSLAMLEIIMSLLYAVFFFSVLASAVRDGDSDPPEADLAGAEGEQSLE
jgi:voltage-gated potassium channel